MDVASIIYFPPLEEEENIPSLAWDKDTIQYAVNNKPKVIKAIRSNTKGMNNINMMDIEDIYSELIEYLFKSNDYDIEKAVECSTGDSIVTLEGYVNNCIKNCTKRYITATYRREKSIIRDVIVDDEGKEKEILDTISDEKSTEAFNNIGYDIKSYLRNLECKRYKYGTDILQVIYVRILTMDKDDDFYRNILEVLGVSKKDLADIEKKIAADPDVIQTLKAISLVDVDVAAKMVETKVYGAKKIRETIAAMA